MKLSSQEFLECPHKAITFMGMSGVGKTYLSSLLETWGWGRVSCDFEIGKTYLAPHLSRPMETVDDIGVLSDLIGKPGRSDLGGLPFEEYKRRQKLYSDAECAAVRAVARQVPEMSGHFVHDSTGSLCEILDEDLLDALGQKTLFVYLKASPEEEALVLERAKKHPKPLFFPPLELDAWVKEYLDFKGLSAPEEMDPDDYSRWVFPKLFAARLPKYQRLADLYGVSVQSCVLHGVRDEADFLARLAEALDD